MKGFLLRSPVHLCNDVWKSLERLWKIVEFGTQVFNLCLIGLILNVCGQASTLSLRQSDQGSVTTELPEKRKTFDWRPHKQAKGQISIFSYCFIGTRIRCGSVNKGMSWLVHNYKSSWCHFTMFTSLKKCFWLFDRNLTNTQTVRFFNDNIFFKNIVY